MVVVYTAIFGGYDTLNPVASGGHSHICFTDHVQRVAGWTFVEETWCADTPRRAARMRKALSHRFLPDAEYSIWIDGNMELPSSPDNMVSTYLREADVAVFAHPDRSCTYQEAAACARMGKDDPATLEEQMQRYREEGFPVGLGLTATGLLIRRHTERICEFNEVWWSEISRHSVRDQVSFMYAIWKTDVSYQIIPGRIGQRPHG